MLKPIHRVPCSPALAACQQLMQRFAMFMCDVNVHGAEVTLANLTVRMPSQIESDWLWGLLQRDSGQQLLLARATTLANMSDVKKVALRDWVQTVSALPAHFAAGATQWPIAGPAIGTHEWLSFKVLMDSFYEKGLRSGLPYLTDGTPVAAGGITYVDYVRVFREIHRMNPHPDAREVCVLCGGPLGYTPHVDHWISKGAVPLLSICRDNLQVICSTCNGAPNKHEKPVHTAGSFADWFHPYLRPGNASLQLEYALPNLAVRCKAIQPADQPKVDNLDKLLNLASRWTREFKAEYLKRQDEFVRHEGRRLRRGEQRQTLQEMRAHVEESQETLDPREPYYEVHRLLLQALAGIDRLRAWHSELQNVV